MNTRNATAIAVHNWNKLFTHVRRTTGIPSAEIDTLLKEYGISLGEKATAVRVGWLIKENGIYVVPSTGQMTADRYDAGIAELRSKRKESNLKYRNKTVAAPSKEELIRLLKSYKLPNGEAEFIIRRRIVSVKEEEV